MYPVITQPRTLGLAAALAMLLGILAQPAHATSRAWQIHWRYSDAMSLRVNPIWEAYVDNVQFDLAGYARYRYGSTARIVLVRNNAFGLEIEYRSNGIRRRTGINMLDVARW